MGQGEGPTVAARLRGYVLVQLPRYQCRVDRSRSRRHSAQLPGRGRAAPRWNMWRTADILHPRGKPMLHFSRGCTRTAVFLGILSRFHGGPRRHRFHSRSGTRRLQGGQLRLRPPG